MTDHNSGGRTSSGGQATTGTGGMWPDGEPQSVRDAAEGTASK